MNLGTFSISLSVKNIEDSCKFYNQLGFEVIDGGHINSDFKDNDQMKWRILESPSVKIGLFQGMFAENILTFNPGNLLDLQSDLKDKGVTFIKEAGQNDPSKSAMLVDPDGNKIMLDQIGE